MLIECPSCTRSYHVARAALGAGGRDVICTHCDTRWFVAGDGAAPADTAILPAGPEIRAEAHSERSRAPTYEETYGKARARPLPGASRRRPSRIGPSFALILGLIAIPSALIGVRVPLVRHVPQLGSFFAAMGLPANIRGLTLAGVATHRNASGQESYLDVQGEIANVRGAALAVPPLRLTIIDAAGQPIYGWTEPAPKRRLDADEHVTFHARLVAPPAAGQRVVVRFAEAGTDR